MDNQKTQIITYVLWVWFGVITIHSIVLQTKIEVLNTQLKSTTTLAENTEKLMQLQSQNLIQQYGLTFIKGEKN